MNSLILSSNHVQKAISDPNFFTKMPEFASLQIKASTMKNAPVKSGCNTCRQRRIQSSLHGDFVNILNSLSTAAMGRLKQYLGTDTLLINAYDSKSGKSVLKRY